MRYEVYLDEAAQDDLDELPAGVRRRILQRLELLAGDPRPRTAKPLRGVLHGAWPLRIGDYRASYDIEEAGKTVVVWAIAHRSRCYDEARRRRR